MNITLTNVASPVSIHTDVQDGYLTEYLPESEVYINGLTESTKPASVVLSWSVDGPVPEDAIYEVRLSADPDPDGAVTMKTVERRVTVTNLMLAERYYWKVGCRINGEYVTSETGTFETSSAGPRFMDIDGITNVRDVGGWPLPDGGRIRQGLLYRGAAPVCDKRRITEDGLDTALNALGIKTEIDLRIESDPSATSYFGESVSYRVVPMKEYTPETARDNICLFFRILADKTIYPAYFHCLSGADRTGLLSFILLALLGTDEGNWLRDYSSTNLSLCDFPRNRKEVLAHAEEIEKYPGSSLSEKTANYLISTGVPEDEIASIRRIFTE